MTEDEIKTLLAIAMAYDNRKPSTANLTAWGEQAERGRWTFTEAREAIHEHHQTSTEYLMPAHITKLIRNERSKPARVDETRQLEGSPSAPPERVSALISDVANRLGWNRRTPTGEQSDAMKVECPYCHAAPKVMCSRLVTFGAHRGERRPLSNFHPSRVDVAKGLES